VPDGAPADPRLHWRTVDIGAPGPLPAADAAACALGTTIKAAGSQPAFRAVDFDAVLAFARAAREAGVARFAVVSALGASARSGNFYSRTKGEMEDALARLGFTSLVIARPSLLSGARRALGQPPRPAEDIAIAATRPFLPFIPLPWRPIAAATVARAMLAAIDEARPGVWRLPSGEMQRLGAAR
jgi:uncharacterized protein YbjT (DUF2867 family)